VDCPVVKSIFCDERSTTHRGAVVNTLLRYAIIVGKIFDAVGQDATRSTQTAETNLL